MYGINNGDDDHDVPQPSRPRHARLTEVRLEREAARKACAVPAEVFEPMRNARGEIVDPVFNGEVA